MIEWEYTELWRKRGEGFCVEVTHKIEPLCVEGRARVEEGRNRWCVYVYIYPAHPHFNAFEGDRLWQEATNAMPLHGGASYLTRHCDTQGNITSIQVGADYHHDGDQSYTYFDDKEEAGVVFYDAELLFAWLQVDKQKQLIAANQKQ